MRNSWQQCLVDRCNRYGILAYCIRYASGEAQGQL
jgi:hypothetical protein